MKNFLATLKNRTPLGWLQLKHNKTRLLTAIAGITFADILIFMQLGFQDALFQTNTQYPRLLQTDIVLVSSQARNFNSLFTFPQRRLLQAMDIPGVKSADELYIASVEWRNPQTREKTSLLAIGQNPDQPALNLPAINQQLDAVKMPNTLLFDKAARGDYQEVISQVEEGKPVTTEMARRTVTIAGLFELGASFGDDGAVVTSEENFLRLVPKREAGTVSMGLINVESGYEAEEVRAVLNEYLPEDVQAFTHAEYVDFELNYLQTNSAIGFIFTLGSAMGFIVGIVIVYQILSTDVNDHLPEYATFKAMGYENSYLLGVVFEEAIILSLVGFVPSVLISLVLYTLTAGATSMAITMPMARVIVVFILTIFMCNISGAIATRKLQAADPADMF